MSDERDRTMPGAGGYGNRTHGWQNPEIGKALNEMVAERAAKERGEADKHAARDSQEVAKETDGDRHKGRNPEVWDALQQMAEEAARGTAEQNQREPEEWHAALEAANIGPAVERQESQVAMETAPMQEGQPAADKEPEAPETADKENGTDVPEQGQAEEAHEAAAEGGASPIENGAPTAGTDIHSTEDKESAASVRPDGPVAEPDRPAQDSSGKEASAQKQPQPGRADDEAKSQKKKDGRDGELFHKGNKKQDSDKEKPKGLFSRLHDFAVRVYQKVKHAVERAIGRGRIPAMPLVNKADFSRSAMDLSGKDKTSVDRATQEKANEKENGRNWGELFYHGFARRLLGKDAYMYAIQQGDKQGRDAQEPARAGQAQNGPDRKEGRAEAQADQREPERPSNTDTHEQGTQDRKENPQKELEEMKGKFNSLHKVITNDLEDRFSNAKEAKEAYIGRYAEQLQEKLTEMNHGEPVQVSAARENGKLEIRINDEPEQYGGYPSFMGCSKIRVEIDGHLNIISAEAFVPTRQTDDGKFIGRKIDISDTLGAYILSDLAKNFREDYNRGAESYNLSSRNEFEKTMMAAAAQGRSEFAIDNINYSISVKDSQIQISQAAGDKVFTIAMSASSRETEAAKEAYESKTEGLQEAERKLEAAKGSYKELAEKYSQNQGVYKQAEAKAMAATQKHKDASIELNKVQKQLSGRYPGAERMDELKEQERKAMGARNEAFKESKDANKEKNVAQAEMDKTEQQMKQARERIAALEHEAAALRDACRESKEQYDSASLAQKDTAREIYQAHAKSVVEGRESSIRAFEEILPGCKNDIGGSLGLEDLGRAMEETGRTSMEEVLNGEARGGLEVPPVDEERGSGLENQEISAELE